MKIKVGNTWVGENGKFTELFYKHRGNWIPGTWDRQTGKREYWFECNTAFGAANLAEILAKKKCGKNPRMILTEKESDK